MSAVLRFAIKGKARNRERESIENKKLTTYLLVLSWSFDREMVLSSKLHVIE